MFYFLPLLCYQASKWVGFFAVSLKSLLFLGFNLTAATTVVFAELYWNPGVNINVFNIQFTTISCNLMSVCIEI